MSDFNTKITSIVRDIDLGDINETKKLSLLDEISETITGRILLRLIEEAPDEKKDLFISKINKHKNEPEKVLLFINHFVEDADKIIDQEIEEYRNSLFSIINTNN
jgi:hypothetical protein